MSSNNKTSNKNNEDDTSCPPGMKFDTEQDKCVPTESHKKEDDNAGDSTSKGTGTSDDANSIDNPAATHECPPNTHWDGEQCVPDGDPAGTPGGGGTGDPDTPGKEAWMKRYLEHMEKIMAAHTSYNEKQLDAFKSSQQLQLEALTKNMGMPSYAKESASFGVKMESSKVDDSGIKSVYEASVAGPAAFFESAKKGIADSTNGFYSWSINPEAYFDTLQKGWMNYGSNQAHGKIEDAKKEGFTISAGDMPQIFSKQVYLIPGGRMRVPIRQFLDTQIIEDADRYNWFKVNGFAFDDVTNEGSAPTTEESQTITKVTATPSLKRANQTVNYSDIENAPFDLIEAFNRAAALGALAAEATEVLDTTYDAITPTNWVNGNDGVAITEDDVANPTTLKQEGVYAAKRLIENQGGDTSPGSMVLFAHPKAVEELILDTAADFFTGQNALHSTALGVLENRLGVDIVVTNAVTAQDNTTNDTYRNVLAMKGSLGLAVAADLQIEAQRRPDLSAVKVGARHRIKGAVIDETMTARISTSQ